MGSISPWITRRQLRKGAQMRNSGVRTDSSFVTNASRHSPCHRSTYEHAPRLLGVRLQDEPKVAFPLPRSLAVCLRGVDRVFEGSNPRCRGKRDGRTRRAHGDKSIAPLELCPKPRRDIPLVVLTDQEFQQILSSSKWVEGDIIWRKASDQRVAFEFRASVHSEEGWPLDVVGRLNPAAGKLSYALLHRGAGRIYALDLGSAHHNPACQRIGDTHKHRGTAAFRDKNAYKPSDVTADWSQPVEAWLQFCAEANLQHRGRMIPPAVQWELLL